MRGVESLEERALLATIMVTNTAPDGPGSLAEAINTANNPISNLGHDTILFARGARGEIALNDELVITDDLTIRGPGDHRLTISGENAQRVFSVLSTDLANPISVDIHRVTIADGVATDAPGFPVESPFAFGGGIYNLGSHVTLNRVRMTGNEAIGGIAAGGAIANEFGGSLTVTRSQLVDNAATGFVLAAGGGITSDIGPSVNPDGSPGDGTPGKAVVTISRASFKGNTAEAQFADPGAAGPFAAFAGFAFGGAFSNLAGDATISHSEFVDNQVVGGDGVPGQAGGFANGGAVYSDDFSPFDAVEPILGRDSSLNVSHSKFTGNSSTGGSGGDGARGGASAGGAISVSIAFLDDAASIRHTTFQHNTAVGGTGGTGGGAGGDALGGALSALAGADVAVASSRFSHNTARGGDGAVGGVGGDGTGGAIGLGRIVTAVPTPLEALLPSLTVNGSMIVSNAALGGDGGVAADGGDGIGGGLGVTAGDTTNIVGSLVLRNRAVGGEAGDEGVNAAVFVTPIVADYEITILSGGPLADVGFPVDVPIPVQAAGDFTFELDAAMLNDPSATSIPITHVSGTLDGVSPEALQPFTLGPFEFNSGSLENVVRDPDGRIISGDVVGLSMEWEQIATLPGLPPLRVFNTDPIPFDGPFTAIPFADGDVISGPDNETIDIVLDTGDGGSILAATGGNRTLKIVGDSSVIAPLGGSGLGGGIANQGGGTMQVRSSLIIGNQAKGRDGGNAEGGGAYNAVDATLQVQRTWILGNQAKAREGLGRGGGVFNAGALELDHFFRVFGNDASDEGDNLFDLSS